VVILKMVDDNEIDKVESDMQIRERKKIQQEH